LFPGSRHFLPSMLSTGWFQELIRT